MEHSLFYEHVSSWIDSYHNAEALEWLKRFVNASTQPDSIKQELLVQIDRKIATLQGWPRFNADSLLLDDAGHVEVFTHRYKALCKVVYLRLRGHDVHAVSSGVFYKVEKKSDNMVMAIQNL